MSEFASINTKLHGSFIDKTTSKDKGEFILEEFQAMIPTPEEVSSASKGHKKGQTMRYGND